MRPNVAAALRRMINDETYRAAVVAWIRAHESGEADERAWRGKRDSAGVPVMNICAGGPPVTVAVETIRFAIDHLTLPEDELSLSFPKPDDAERQSSQVR